jgi:Tfp pilus assembly protein PilO
MNSRLSHAAILSYAVGGGMIVLFLLGGLLPYWFRQHQLGAEIEQHRAALAQAAEQSARLEQATRRGQYLLMQTGAFADLVRDRRDLGPFLAELSSAMDQSGLLNTSQQAPPPVRLRDCEQQPIEVTASGRYQDVYAFLNRLEHLPRRSIINSLRLEADKDLTGEVTLKLMLSIYSHEPES